jgi:hypothetical protein
MLADTVEEELKKRTLFVVEVDVIRFSLIAFMV